MNKIIPAIARRLARVPDYIAHPISPWQRFYRTQNPWRFERPSEIHRFKDTNRIIREAVGPVGSILEFASAEGDQTEHLLDLGARVQGVEISATAVRRARRKFAGNPNVSFSIGKLETIRTDQRFDLVTAFEILYYVKPDDIPAVLDMMDRLGRHRIVSMYWPNVEVLEKFVLPLRNVQRQIISWEGEPRWLVAWW